MLEYMSIDSLMNVKRKLLPYQGELLEDVGRYRRLVEKLNYLLVTRSNITFIVNDESFLSALRTTHLKVVMKILRYLKEDKTRGLL